jgi:hypothetical protein
MLRISQTANAKNRVVPQRSFHGTTALRAASSAAPVACSDLPERDAARSVPPVPLTVDDSIKPSSSLEGWETEGGAPPPVN